MKMEIYSEIDETVPLTVWAAVSFVLALLFFSLSWPVVSVFFLVTASELWSLTSPGGKFNLTKYYCNADDKEKQSHCSLLKLLWALRCLRKEAVQVLCWLEQVEVFQVLMLQNEEQKHLQQQQRWQAGVSWRILQRHYFGRTLYHFTL